MNFDQPFEPSLELIRRENRYRIFAELESGLPVMPSASHVVPVLVGGPQRCGGMSDELLVRFGTCVRSVNYPTVPRETERLRLPDAAAYRPGH
jgi:5-aminolevulinate synthase